MMLDVNALIRQLVMSEFKPAVIVGIARGGLTPGVMISHWLNLPFKPIHASLRDFPHWEAYLPKSTDKQVLVVDDICDSGETFEKMVQHINNPKDNSSFSNKTEVRFATLWWNNECEFKPHYWVRDCAKDSGKIWIHFPWEAWWSSPLQTDSVEENFIETNIRRPVRGDFKIPNN
tara:strand:+ start:107 stop:631 length:525 start_codon:yes stop_codon:yes gene_type:complete